MEASHQRRGELWSLLVAHGFEDAFGESDTARVECPACHAPRALKLSLATGQARCASCGVSAPIRTYLSQLEDAEIVQEPEVFTEAEIIPLRPDRLPAVRREPETVASDEEVETWRAELLDEPQGFGGAQEMREALPGAEAGTAAAGASGAEVRPRRRGVFEALIIILLSLVFLGAGLAAAGLSAFANYQAFSASVADDVPLLPPSLCMQRASSSGGGGLPPAVAPATAPHGPSSSSSSSSSSVDSLLISSTRRDRSRSHRQSQVADLAGRRSQQYS